MFRKITIEISNGVIFPGPVLISSETHQEALEQVDGGVLGLRIEGPFTEGYW